MNSDYSNCASDTTGVAGSPKATTNLRATSVSTSQVNLAWTDNSTDETGFEIYRKAGAGSWTLLTTTAANVKNYGDITATGNASTKTYSYYVKACNASLCSPSTNTAVVPYKPTDLTATAASGRINLTWEDNSSNEAGFKVYRKSGLCSSANSWSLITTTGSNVSSYSNSGLLSGRTYSYRVKAYSSSLARPYANGYSGNSNCVSATTP
jgi:fibronectin type 3 domain-containing protein